MADTRNALTPLGPSATRLGVTQSWLKEEAIAGRIPHLRAGRRLLFDVEFVAALLRDRARSKEGVPDAR